MSKSYHGVEQPMIKLHVTIMIPGETPREFDLTFDAPAIGIGRDADNLVQIPLSTVSRHHARIMLENGDWFAEDLHSTHGTQVNNQTLGSGGRKLLRDGDRIQVVHASLEFHLESAPVLAEDAGDEQTSVVARQMVQEVLKNLDSNSDAPHLIVMNGATQGQKFELAPNMAETIIGRGDACEIRLDDANISRRHAKISREWNDILVEDLGSKNGVTINHQPIRSPTILQDADEIGIGPIRLVFVDNTASLLSKLGEMPAFAKEVASATPAVSETPPPEAAETQTSETDSAAETQIPPAPAEPDSVGKPSKKLGLPDYLLFGLATLVAIGLIIGSVLAWWE